MTQITPIDSSLPFKERVELFYLRANYPLFRNEIKRLMDDNSRLSANLSEALDKIRKLKCST
jgi:hypothetical protein